MNISRYACNLQDIAAQNSGLYIRRFQEIDSTVWN
jgi:hypothetical protein